MTLIALLAALLALSLWLRVRRYRDSVAGVETKTSPLSAAVQELVATAGGVYVAIIAMTSFLKLDMPERVSVLHASVDPLALSAVGLAIGQPFFSRLLGKHLKK